MGLKLLVGGGPERREMRRAPTFPVRQPRKKGVKTTRKCALLANTNSFNGLTHTFY
jgi:hypothetical protein